jgi:hypothetical protein
MVFYQRTWGKKILQTEHPRILMSRKKMLCETESTRMRIPWWMLRISLFYLDFSGRSGGHPTDLGREWLLDHIGLFVLAESMVVPIQWMFHPFDLVCIGLFLHISISASHLSVGDVKKRDEWKNGTIFSLRVPTVQHAPSRSPIYAPSLGWWYLDTQASPILIQNQAWIAHCKVKFGCDLYPQK